MDLTDICRKLNTADLCLRSPALTDATGMFAMLSDAETVRYWSHQPVTDISEAVKKLNENLESDAQGNSITWAITMKDDDSMIGHCVLFHFDQDSHRAEIGFMMNRDYWQRGYMQQVLQAVLDFGIEKLELHRFEADVDPGNNGSLALLEKLGFEREGYFRERWLICGEWKDSVMLALLNPG